MWWSKQVFGSLHWRALVRRGGLCAIAFQIFGSPAYGSGDSGLQSIAYVHVEGGSFVTIQAHTPFNNPDGCGNSLYVMLQSTTPGFSTMFAQVLAVQAAGNPIDFWLVGCASTPWGFTVPIAVSSTG
jgi:hypothetical protein